jgi:hypothetical protein
MAWPAAKRELGCRHLSEPARELPKRVWTQQTRSDRLTLLEPERRPLHHGDVTGRTWRGCSSLKADCLLESLEVV